MKRGVDTIQALQQLVPEWMIPLFVLISSLGSLWVILPLLTLLYWRWDRERAGFIGSSVLGGVALAFVLKHSFTLPRPAAAMQLVHATGYGFPSGHAIDSTVTYGSLASVAEVGTRWQRVLLASLLIGSIALPRVVLGVHYGIDVIVGIGVGFLYLFIVVQVLDQQIMLTLLLAIVLAIAGVIVTGGSWGSLILLSGILVTLVNWARREVAKV